MIPAQTSHAERPKNIEASGSHATLTRSAAARNCWEGAEAGFDWTRFFQVPCMVCDGQLRKDLVCLCDTVWILAVPLLVEPLQIPLQIQRAANTVVAGPYFERHALDVMIWESLQSLHTAAEKSLNVSRCCDANFSGPLVRQDKLRLQRDGYGEETVGTKESASL